MVLRLRQVAFVASELAPAIDDICKNLGVEICHRDPGVGKYGLENALVPVGNQFIEVVAPIEEQTAGGRYLERRGGDGGYMLIFQCDDQPRRRAGFENSGVRLVSILERPDYQGMQLHPKDSGGTFLEIDQPLGPTALDPDGPWYPAGDDWKPAKRLDTVTEIVGAEIQSGDPQATAARWSELLEVPLAAAGGAPALRVDNATIRFVPCRDGRPEGLGGIEVRAVDPAGTTAAAVARGVPEADGALLLCGVRVRLV